MHLTNRVVLVTGGASGLGGATVDMIVEAGGRAVIADVNEQTGQAAATRLGGAVRFVKTDVTSDAEMQRAVDAGLQAFGAIHGLVCAAGIATAERVLPKEGVLPLDRFTRIITVNLVGTFNAIRLTAAAMAKNEPTEGDERGVIVTTASVAAFDGQIGQAAYSASKGGIVAMTLPLAREFARMGVRVMTIAPGTFDTPLMGGLPEAARESLAQQVPFPSRLGRPPEYAALVRHIFENEMLNGEVIRLDGAIRMAPK
ncbi:MAG: 3-hydroxy-2-methylbutyryl-CoA dehydrogenase [Acidobacteria bacterium RIFCSPLOWO2_12_FULL_67_14]|nr:MAG: 3-hydroxy-2-methylbutyryl-CoA dehydrogenase [Acidobacteria bacterium RIFCSPLOWO2_02_FULL_67_21]OFW38301.1 MAG: 3-hydroxy-2-methylbutyryl-CoA dehydrogenase [Acidobacteria bacterium RIFCSPLOWO2_12_FULL_67_14]